MSLIRRRSDCADRSGLRISASSLVRRIRDVWRTCAALSDRRKGRSFLGAFSAKLRDAVAVEIGGPSPVFGADAALPFYPLIGSVDLVNFSSTNVWTPNTAGLASLGARAGKEFIREAGALTGIGDHSYDLLLASHCLEHLANPVTALREWARVLRPGGLICVIVPDRTMTFDHRRPVTSFEHLLDDARRATQEDDLSHLPEILSLHDLARDPPAGTFAEFERRSRNNVANRCLHHHVFDLPLVARLLAHTGFVVEGQVQLQPFHLVTVAQRLRGESIVAAPAPPPALD